MADWPQSQESNRVTIPTSAPDSIGTEIMTSLSALATATTWPAANLAYYIPFVVQAPFLAQKLVARIVTSSGNWDGGIYDSGQHRLASIGSTAMPAAGAGSIDITDTLLLPGEYYAALNVGNTSARIVGWTVVAVIARGMGVFEQAVGATALPDPATFATMTHTFLPGLSVHGRTLA